MLTDDLIMCCALLLSYVLRFCQVMVVANVTIGIRCLLFMLALSMYLTRFCVVSVLLVSPVGATCKGEDNVLASAGYFHDPLTLGDINTDQDRALYLISFYKCMTGYCCPYGECTDEKPCTLFRENIMCGECWNNNFTVDGTRCTRCDYVAFSWLTIGSFMYIFLYALFLLQGQADESGDATMPVVMYDSLCSSSVFISDRCVAAMASCYLLAGISFKMYH